MLCTPISRQHFHLNCIISISIAWDTVLALPSFGLSVKKFWYCNDSLKESFYFHCGMNCTWMNRTWMNCICKLSDIYFWFLNPQLKFYLYSMTEISFFYSPLLLCLFKDCHMSTSLLCLFKLTSITFYPCYQKSLMPTKHETRLLLSYTKVSNVVTHLE